jgi:hypothetical protein
MTESKPTEGPYQYENCYVLGPQGQIIALVFSPDDEHDEVFYDEDIRKPNGRLLAASWEMREALEEAEHLLDYFAEGRTYLEGGGTPKTCVVQIRAVLAKAGART